DPLLSRLGWYGGPTPTFALLPGRPAPDAGGPDSPPPPGHRGLPPPEDGPTHIGAVQTQPGPLPVPPPTHPRPPSRLLSLREAVNLANVLPGDNTVSFDPSLGYGTITLAAGQLELSGSVGVQTIDGGHRLTLSGNDSSRIFQIDPGTRAAVRGFDLGH